jgi:hypothetical protein
MQFYLLDYFVERIYQVYGVTYYLARRFYERWDLDNLRSKKGIDSFLNSDLLRGVLVSKDGINFVKRYEEAELLSLGVVLEIENENEHLFKDSKYGFRWRQLYHGFSEVWLDLYMIVDPPIDDKAILEWVSSGTPSLLE